MRSPTSTTMLLGALVALASAQFIPAPSTGNFSFQNPMLPGFHPDPSCIQVPDWEDMFVCVSSSFNSFPGIPIHGSNDLKRWRLLGHVLNRREQLPRLIETNRSTSGIWAPTIRYNEGRFYVTTTLVDDDRPQDDPDRWDNIIFESDNIYDETSWSDPVHFEFEGYDPSPFWDTDGKVYITGAHSWRVGPWIDQAEIDLKTGKTSEWKKIWDGTGGQAPEGPHIYLKDGYYYLLAAEGGTGVGHFVSMARSKSINGPYEAHPGGPVLTNANTTEYFQTVGHADLFQDTNQNWWAVALSTRGGPAYKNYPMGRETVLTPVTWKEGEWPVFDPIRGNMTGPNFPYVGGPIDFAGPFVTAADDISFEPGSALPPYFTHWRPPIEGSYVISLEDHPNTLQLKPSKLNLTALNGNYAGPTGQTFVSRRQTNSLFTYSVDLEFNPPATDGEVEVEAGVTVFLTQRHHLDLGIVNKRGENGEIVPRLRARGISSNAVPAEVVRELPKGWTASQKLRLEIRADNATHYVFSAGLAGEQMEVVWTAGNEAVSWGFTGALLGVFATSNGGTGSTPAYVSRWKYQPRGQCRDEACSGV